MELQSLVAVCEVRRCHWLKFSQRSALKACPSIVMLPQANGQIRSLLQSIRQRVCAQGVPTGGDCGMVP